ncbi:hypothetical protein PV325_004316 [Microctonus aethiopoides]|nr:hypothetical protein PV325_004316 [Microctonus aethiopoides]
MRKWTRNRERERSRSVRGSWMEEGITQLHVGLMLGFISLRGSGFGAFEGDGVALLPTVGGKIEYESSTDRTYRTGSDTEGASVTTDNPTTPFPTPPPTLSLNHRQASPFPMENTNSRRHHYSSNMSTDRSRNGNGEVIYAAPTKKISSGGNSNSGSGGGTLGRRNRRGQHNSALSSSSTASDRSETIYPDEHSRMHLNNGLPYFRKFWVLSSPKKKSLESSRDSDLTQIVLIQV